MTVGMTIGASMTVRMTIRAPMTVGVAVRRTVVTVMVTVRVAVTTAVGIPTVPRVIVRTKWGDKRNRRPHDDHGLRAIRSDRCRRGIHARRRVVHHGRSMPVVNRTKGLGDDARCRNAR